MAAFIHNSITGEWIRKTRGQQREFRGKQTSLCLQGTWRYIYWKGGSGSRQEGHGEGAALWDLGRELTIGHTRGEVLSLVVSASAEVAGALSRGLRRLALQHVDYVHAVDTLQSCVQALHCSEDA